MDLTLNSLLDAVLGRYGFEHTATVGFFQLVSKYNGNPTQSKFNEIISTYCEIMS